MFCPALLTHGHQEGEHVVEDSTRGDTSRKHPGRILQLFAQMNSTISADQSTACSERANQHRQSDLMPQKTQISSAIVSTFLYRTYTPPALRILKLEEDLPGRRTVAHDPEHDQHREEAEGVNDQHAALECRESAEEHGVEEDRDDDVADGE